MDPVTLATVTAGATILASDCAKGIATEAGKDLWARVKRALKIGADPAPGELAPTLAARMLADEAATREVITLLQANVGGIGSAGAIVGNVSADKLVVIHTQHVAGDFNLSM
ncbi:MAG TPA: hypothetical protein VFH27_09805 [Longimicrobiaceae bacterium]|nr:hypothetical protein [Longimicrobiaceae bacterium]